MKPEVLARWSGRAILLAVFLVGASAVFWWEFHIQGRHVLDGRSGFIWPLAALATIPMALWAVLLLGRLAVSGTAMIVKSRDQFLVFYPWKRVIAVGDVRDVRVSEYGSAIGVPKQIVSGPQIELIMRGGNAIKIRTPLLKEPAEVIASRLKAALRPISGN